MKKILFSFQVILFQTYWKSLVSKICGVRIFSSIVKTVNANSERRFVKCAVGRLLHRLKRTEMITIHSLEIWGENLIDMFVVNMNPDWVKLNEFIIVRIRISIRIKEEMKLTASHFPNRLVIIISVSCNSTRLNIVSDASACRKQQQSNVIWMHNEQSRNLVEIVQN